MTQTKTIADAGSTPAGSTTLGSTMADKNDKYPDNVPGKFYVDRECIFCNVCADAAPNNFKMSEYHAAVALASLDEYFIKRQRFQKKVRNFH